MRRHAILAMAFLLILAAGAAWLWHPAAGLMVFGGVGYADLLIEQRAWRRRGGGK